MEANVTSGEGETIHDHNEDEDEGEGYSDPHDLGGEFNTLEDTEEDNEPNEDLGKPDLPLKFTLTAHGSCGIVLLAIISDGVKDVLVEVLLSDGVLFAGLSVVSVSSLRRPGEGVVEAGEEVDEGPRNDHIVIE